MQTAFSTELSNTEDGRDADRILRSCVHCGFCTATCPTFLETGNELDSPRGRIYLIKTMLETGEASVITRNHLDRCLTCQSCETTCPSNVDYHSLLNIGRRTVEAKLRRSPMWHVRSWLLRRGLTSRRMLKTGLWVGRLFRGILPRSLAVSLRRPRGNLAWSITEHPRRMVILKGCAQEGLAPDINAAASRVFDRLGITLETISAEGCCGALAFHLNAQSEGLDKARHNIDQLCIALDDGTEAIISTASGCGNFVLQYAELLRGDPAYAEKAARVVAATADISAVLAREDLSGLSPENDRKVAFHCPCTLQHGLGLGDSTQALLTKLGFSLTKVKEGHICCGSAGAYSVMEPAMSRALRKRKLKALTEGSPDALVTANIGCQLHLAQTSEKPVMHWIVLLDELLNQPSR